MNKYAGLMLMVDKQAALSPYLSRTHLPTVRNAVYSLLHKAREGRLAGVPVGKDIGKTFASNVSQNAEGALLGAVLAKLPWLLPVPGALPLSMAAGVGTQKALRKVIQTVSKARRSGAVPVST